MSIHFTAGKRPVTAKTNLSLRFECVGVQSIHVIEDHVIIQRDIGAGKKKKPKKKPIRDVYVEKKKIYQQLTAINGWKSVFTTNLVAILKTSVAQAATKNRNRKQKK